MLEPDSTVRMPPPEGAPSAFGPNTLQILTTEHWSLLAARNLVYTESMSRAAMFIAALSGAVVALALVAQATDFGSGFVAFALVLLPVVYFLGIVTIVRLAQVNHENRLWVQGMNRIRNAYLELAPELEPYFVTSRYDDEAGVLVTSLGAHRAMPKLQPFIAVPGVIAVIDSVVAGAAAGIAGLGVDVGVAPALAIGAGFFVLSMLLFALWARAQIGTVSTGLEPIFPAPSD